MRGVLMRTFIEITPLSEKNCFKQCVNGQTMHVRPARRQTWKHRPLAAYCYPTEAKMQFALYTRTMLALLKRTL